MISLELFDRARCTREQKASVITTALDILNLAEQARREGILSLEEVIENCSQPFLQKLLMMVVDSVDPEVIRSVGETSIAMSALSGQELLEAMIILEGALSIQKGDNPYILHLLLSAYLGNDVDLLDYEDPLHLNDSPIAETESKATPQERGVEMQSIAEDIRNGIMLTDIQITSLESSCRASNPFQDMQTEIAAIALMYMDENARMVAMNSLTTEKQSYVLQAICELSDFDAASFIELARSSLQNMVNVMQANYRPAGGFGAAAALLRSLPRQSVNIILENLKKAKPELAIRLHDSLFTFEDIIFIEDLAMQKVIREVDSIDLTHALKGASPAISAKFFNNVSARVARALREDMEFMGPILIADIKEARKKIITIIRHLEECGDVVLIYPDEDRELMTRADLI